MSDDVDQSETSEKEQGTADMSMDDFLSAGLNEGETEEEQELSPQSEEVVEAAAQAANVPEADQDFLINQEAGTVTFPELKVDGEIMQNVVLSLNEMPDAARMKFTFDRRMSELDRDRKSFEAEKSKPLSDEEIRLKAQLAELNDFKSQHPEEYAQMINAINQARIQGARPDKSPLDEKLEQLKKVAAENTDVPVLTDFVDTFAAMRSELEEKNKQIAQQLRALNASTDSVTQTLQQRQQAEAQAKFQQEINDTVKYLNEKGISFDTIQAKQHELDKWYQPGKTSVREVAEYVFQRELLKAEMQQSEPKKQAPPKQPSPKLVAPSGTTAGHVGSLSPSEEYAALSEALYGRVVPQPMGASK